MKKLFLFSLVLFPQISLGYTSLTNIDKIQSSKLVLENNSLAILFNQAFFLMLAVAIALAIFMIIRGGYSYILSADSSDAKGDAKKKIQASFGGLLLALGAVVILQFINPEILKLNFVFPVLEKPEGATSTPVRKYYNYTLEDEQKARQANAKLKSEDIEKMFSNGFQKEDADLLIKRDSSLDNRYRASLEDLRLMDSAEIYGVLTTQLARVDGDEEYAAFLKSLFDTRLEIELRVSEIGYSNYVDINRRILKTEKATLGRIRDVLFRLEEVNKVLPNTRNEQSVFWEQKDNYTYASFAKVKPNCPETPCL